MTRHVARRRSNMHQSTIRFAPRCWVAQLDFAHAVEDGLPEVAEYREGFGWRNFFVQHFPDHGQLHERAGSALARDEAIGEADQLKETLLPGANTYFHINPGIHFGGEKLRGHAVGFSAGLFCALRDPGHHSAVAAAANGETVFYEHATKCARVFVVRIALVRARAAEYGDDSLFRHVHSRGLM